MKNEKKLSVNYNELKKELAIEQLLDSKTHFAVDFRMQQLLNFVTNFNNSLSNTIYEMNTFLDSHNSKLHSLLMPFISKLNYEFDRVESFLEIISNKMDIQKEEMNINQVLKLIFKEYDSYFKQFKITVNLIENTQIILLTKKYLLTFILEDIIKRIVRLNIAKNINILLEEKDNTYLIVITIELNLKSETIFSSFENLMGIHYKYYFQKITNIEYNTDYNTSRYKIMFKTKKEVYNDEKYFNRR